MRNIAVEKNRRIIYIYILQLIVIIRNCELSLSHDLRIIRRYESNRENLLKNCSMRAGVPGIPAPAFPLFFFLPTDESDF